MRRPPSPGRGCPVLAGPGSGGPLRPIRLERLDPVQQPPSAPSGGYTSRAGSAPLPMGHPGPLLVRRPARRPISRPSFPGLRAPPPPPRTPLMGWGSSAEGSGTCCVTRGHNGKCHTQCPPEGPVGCGPRCQGDPEGSPPADPFSSKERGTWATECGKRTAFGVGGVGGATSLAEAGTHL